MCIIMTKGHIATLLVSSDANKSLYVTDLGKGPFRAFKDFSVLAFIVLPHLKPILQFVCLSVISHSLPTLMLSHVRCFKTAT